MHRETEDEDPLERAIADLREDIDRFCADWGGRRTASLADAKGLTPHYGNIAARTADNASESNPRARLDALAKHLDGRIKRAQAAQSPAEAPSGE